MMELYRHTTFECSKLITKHYSTSFTLGIRTLDKSLHESIYAIYGFVRYADEIVDTFHSFDKAKLLENYKKETYKAIEEGISLNPVIHAFQDVVNRYNIEHDLIEAFLHSMEMDLHQSTYEDRDEYEEYIYGSAEVVGLMCLRVFCDGEDACYNSLKDGARSLGAAFQKVNFLRDMKSDHIERGRVYFPGVQFTEFNNFVKKQIEDDIQADFDAAYEAIVRLPKKAKLGVYLAYVYYLTLFKKIKNANADLVQQERIRVPDHRKLGLLLQTYLKSGLNLI